MDFFDFIDQYSYSREKEDKEKIWEIWAIMYPKFNKDTFISFPDFCDMMLGKTKKENKKLSSNGKTDEERIAEAEDILRKMEFVEKS